MGRQEKKNQIIEKMPRGFRKKNKNSNGNHKPYVFSSFFSHFVSVSVKQYHLLLLLAIVVGCCGARIGYFPPQTILFLPVYERRDDWTRYRYFMWFMAIRTHTSTAKAEADVDANGPTALYI